MAALVIPRNKFTDIGSTGWRSCDKPCHEWWRGTLYPEVISPTLIPLDTAHSLSLWWFLELPLIPTPHIFFNTTLSLRFWTLLVGWGMTRSSNKRLIFVGLFLPFFAFFLPPSTFHILSSNLPSSLPFFFQLLDPQSIVLFSPFLFSLFCLWTFFC